MLRLRSATAIIAIVTVALSAIAIFGGIDFWAVFAGFIPARLSGLIDLPGALPAWITPFSSALIHGGWVHLFVNMLMLVFAMLVGPFVLNGWITFSMLKRMNVVRRAPRRTMAGDPVSVEIELSNEKNLLSAWLMWRGAVPEPLQQAANGLLPYLPLLLAVPAAGIMTSSELLLADLV